MEICFPIYKALVYPLVSLFWGETFANNFFKLISSMFTG